LPAFFLGEKLLIKQIQQAVFCMRVFCVIFFLGCVYVWMAWAWAWQVGMMIVPCDAYITDTVLVACGF